MRRFGQPDAARARQVPFQVRPAWVDLRGKLPGRETYARRKLSDIKYIVIHHSAVDVDSSAQSVAEYHVDALGWPGIGYHFLVHWNGALEYVGDLLTVRYNVASRNLSCAGICLPGDWTKRLPPAPQLASAREVIGWLRRQCPQARVVGHRDIALKGYETACPGFDVATVFDS